MATLKKDWTLKVLLLAVAGLLAANLAALSGVGTARAAQGGLPDTGAQFDAMITELKGVNSRLDAMEKFLEGGTLTVNVKADKDTDKR